MENQERILKAKASTDVAKLAGAIVSYSENEPTIPIIVRSVGAGALNQALKGIIIAKKSLSKKGKLVTINPSFKELPRDAKSTITSIEQHLIITDEA